jgi:signal peptidase II
MKKLDALLFITLVGLDQLTKWIVVMTMPLNDSITLIPSFLSLTHARNFGASWSLFQNQMPFLIGVTLVALTIFIIWYVRLKPDFTLERLGLVLMIGGTIGNFIDRVTLGYVVDFIDVLIFGYDFPIFNVADIALTCGVIALLIYELKGVLDVKRH